MTTWTSRPFAPSRSALSGGAIADALAADIAGGRLATGQQLPTHRDLAYRLHVTVGTVSRAYAEAVRRGLIGGEIGRGTYVRARIEPAAPGPALPANGEIDFAINAVVTGGESAALAEMLAELGAEPSLAELLGYLPHTGLPGHRAAIARLLRQLELEVAPERIVLTAGAQHAMLVALTALTHPGDTIACEQLTYAGFKSVARLLHLRVKGIAMDARACGPMPSRRPAARPICACSICARPCRTRPASPCRSSAARRSSAIAARHDVKLIEDDVYGFLSPGAPPPLVSLAPERVFYLNGTSKSLAPACASASWWCRPTRSAEIANSVRTTVWMAPPLMAEMVRRWIESGLLMRFIDEKRRIGRDRQALARRILGPTGTVIAPTHANALHLWAALPEPWTDEAFASEARRNGVQVTAGALFAVGRPPIEAIRIALGAPALDRVGRARPHHPGQPAARPRPRRWSRSCNAKDYRFAANSK
ncbi:MAG: PLP-dependent aminotransferase family protein [Pseudomonadota bacterium]